MTILWYFMCVGLLGTLLSPTPCVAPGVNKELKDAEERIYGNIDGLNPKQQQDREYFRYILRLSNILTKDPAWVERSDYVSDEKAINEGKLTDGLFELLAPETKQRLDTLKKGELKFQVDLLSKDKTHMLQKERNEWNPVHQSTEEMEHFTQKDLDLLMGRFKGIAALRDAKRREKFKQHEMDKELKYRDDLEKEDEEGKKKLEEKKKNLTEKTHEKMHAPMHEAQLKEVWEKSDGLDPESYDTKTLFKLHDKDGDGFLDEYELETFFLLDLEKSYPEDDEETDMEDRDEEMERMREMSRDVDTDQDGRVSLEEMLTFEKSGGFKDDEEYEPLTESKDFTEDELSEYKDELEKGKEGGN